MVYSETSEYSEDPLGLRLSTSILTVVTGNRTSFIAFVNNTGTDTVKSVRILIEGIPPDWIIILPLTNDISPGETKEHLVTINVPSNAKTGIYNLNVKATNEVESEAKNLTMIVGSNQKEMADLFLSELEKVKTIAKDSLFIKDCMEIGIIQSSYNDADIAYDNGLKEYNNGNYINAINWFEYALPVYDEVVYRVDITLRVEIETTNKSKFIIPPGFHPEKQLEQAEIYFSGKDYEKICDPIIKIRNLIMIGLVFWPLIAILLIILLILCIIVYKRKRGREKTRILKQVEKRLKIEDKQQALTEKQE